MDAVNKKRIDSVWLLLTNKCNLSCKYCWSSNYGSDIKKESMTREIIDQSMVFIKENCLEGAGITLFGGEPLLEFALIEYIMNKYPTMNYGIYTNATLLNDDIIQFFISRRDFIKITLSIDGESSTQLKNRGKLVNENTLRRMFKSFPSINARMTAMDPDSCYDNVKYLYGLGARSIHVNVPYFVKLDPDYYKKMDVEYSKIKEDYFINKSVKSSFSQSEKFCKAGTNYISIDTQGNIHPCDLFYWLGKYKLGNVYSGIDTRILDELNDSICKEDFVYTGCIAEQLLNKDIAENNYKSFSLSVEDCNKYRSK